MVVLYDYYDILDGSEVVEIKLCYTVGTKGKYHNTTDDAGSNSVTLIFVLTFILTLFYIPPKSSLRPLYNYKYRLSLLLDLIKTTQVQLTRMQRQ